MKKTVKDCDLKGKRVLLRADYNVPMDQEGNITEYMRIEESIPTLKYILGQGASIIQRQTGSLYVYTAFG